MSSTIGAPYKRDRGPDSADAVVIGSGIGGLTTAALLGARLGKRVVVLERHYTAGGFTHTFRRPGYEWDVGIHYVGQVNDAARGLGAMLAGVSDGSLQWTSMGDVYDTVVIGGRRFEYVTGVERWRARMADDFPREAAGLDRYLRLVRAATRSSTGFFAEKAVPRPVAALGGGLMRAKFMKYARRTTGEVIGSITSDRTLAAVLAAQWGDYGLPPSRSSFAMHAILTRHYFDGAYYPVGGASRIGASILPRIEASGGRVLVDAEVQAILLEGGRACGVRMADGRELRAPLVISDAGAATTMRLLPREAPGREELDGVLARVKPSAAHLCLYVGLSRAAEDLGLPRANVWCYPSPDLDGDLARYEADPGAPVPLAFVSFPSAKDPAFATRFPGRATVEVVTLAPYSWFDRWADAPWRRRGPEYDDLKARFTTRLLDILQQVAPSTRGAVDVAELSTPLSTRHFTNVEHGEIYGLEHSPQRFEERALQPRTAVPGLFLTGCDVSTCGLGGALAGGYLTASVIAGRPLFPR
jgi:all-trans-retinol 13,14-reductase